MNPSSKLLNRAPRALPALLLLLAAMASCSQEKKVAPLTWTSDIDFIQERLPLAPPIETCLWSSEPLAPPDGRLSVPGPTDYAFRGFLRVSRENMAPLLKRYHWEKAAFDPAKIVKPTSSALASEFLAAPEFLTSRDLIKDHNAKSPCPARQILYTPQANVLYFDLTTM